MQSSAAIAVLTVANYTFAADIAITVVTYIRVFVVDALSTNHTTGHIFLQISFLTKIIGNYSTFIHESSYIALKCKHYSLLDVKNKSTDKYS